MGRKLLVLLMMCALVFTVQTPADAASSSKKRPVVSSKPMKFGTLDGQNGSALAKCKLGKRTMLIISGDFKAYRDVRGTRHVADKLAVVDAYSSAFRWGGTAINGWVQTVKCYRGVVYIGGEFTLVNGVKRHRTAALRLSDGKLLSWTRPSKTNVWAIDVTKSAVYTAGKQVTASTFSGRLLWRREPDCAARALLIKGKYAYVGGFFDSYEGKRGHGLVKIHLKNGKPVRGFTPSIDRNRVHCSKEVRKGSNAHYSGSNPLSLSWDSSRKALISCDGGMKNRVRSVNSRTGKNRWVRNLPGDGQICQVLPGDRVFAGFHRSKATPKGKKAMSKIFELKNGKETRWRPSPDFAGGGVNRDGRNNGVIGVTIVGSRLYLTGAFTSAGGRKVNRLAVFPIRK